MTPEEDNKRPARPLDLMRVARKGSSRRRRTVLRRVLDYALILCAFLLLVGAAGFIGVLWVFWTYGRELPDYQQLTAYDPPVATRIHAGNGALIAEYAREKRVFVPVAAIPPQLIHAFLSAEDKAFYTHRGIDFRALARAAITNALNYGSGKRPIGASTITQQVTKNFLLTNEVSIDRKIREAILAMRMERAFTKDQILALYLNEIYLGLGSYGVAAAALNYFDKSLDQLTLSEMAYLAALPKAPANYHPVRRTHAAIQRRNWVLTQMQQNGYIDQTEAGRAAATSLDVAEQTGADSFPAPHFAEEVRRYVVAKFGEDALYNGGLSVRTTLHPTLQRAARRALVQGLEALDRRQGWRGPLAKLDTAGIAAANGGLRAVVIAGDGENAGDAHGVGTGDQESVGDTDTDGDSAGLGEGDQESAGDAKIFAEGLGIGFGEGLDEDFAEGLGIGFGEGLGEDFAEGLGIGFGEGLGEDFAEGLGISFGEGLGESFAEGFGEGLGVGVGVGSGEGLGQGPGEGIGEGVEQSFSERLALREGLDQGSDEGVEQSFSERLGLGDGVGDVAGAGEISAEGDVDGTGEVEAKIQIEEVLRDHERTMLDNHYAALVTSVTRGEARILTLQGPARIPFQLAFWAYPPRDEEGVRPPPLQDLRDALEVGDIVMVQPPDQTPDLVRGEFVPQPGDYALSQLPAVDGAIVAIDPHTGRLLAMSGGYNYRVSEFNRAVQARRQPGSAFKPFVYLAALDQGYNPTTRILDAPLVVDQGPGKPKWKPANYTKRFYGPSIMRVGIEKSRNLMTARLAMNLGMEQVHDYAKKFGINENLPLLLSMSLGAGETTLLRLTTAYGMLVNGGKQITPSLVDRVQDRHGHTIDRHDTRECPSCRPEEGWADQSIPELADVREQLTSPTSAFQMVSMLEGAVKRGTGRRVGRLGLEVAGKTGTTNDNTNAWFVGFTPDLAIGVFVGYDTPRRLGKNETGASTAAPIFADFLAEAQSGKPEIPFRRPSGITIIPVHSETGERVTSDHGKAIYEVFKLGQRPGSNIIDVPRVDGAQPVSDDEIVIPGLF